MLWVMSLHSPKQTDFDMVRRVQAFSEVSLFSHSMMAGGSGLENKDCNQTLAK
jgi:hypothetical protein